MEIPSFLSQKGNTLLFNQEGEFLFYIPETYFGNTKNPVAKIIGYFVSTVGAMDWAIVSPNGKVGTINPFKWPTIVLCKPDSIEKVKNLQIANHKPRDYRILHFKKGDEVISDINIPEIVDNVETLFRLMIITGAKMPNTIPYDQFFKYFPESMRLNGGDFGINMQIFGVLESEVLRDPKDPSIPFRHTKMTDMAGYQQISVIQVPKYTSPYVALTSQNWDESLIAANLMDDDSKIKSSPMEKIITS